VAVGCQIDDVGGSGIDLGELQWAVASSPAGPFVFTPVAASGAAPTYALREVIPAAAQGFLFDQFSGRDLAGNNRSFSPIILVRIDRTAPQLAGMEGIDGQVRTTPALALNVSAVDGLSGLDLDASWVRWESESSNATVSLSSGQVIWVDEGASARVLLSFSTPVGWSTVTLTILDRAGNALQSGPHRAYLNVAPRLTLHGIANGSTVRAGVDVVVAVDVEDEDGSPWNLSSSVDGVTRPDGPPLVLNVAPGYHILVVTATDSFGLRDSITIEFYAEERTSPSGAGLELAVILVILAIASTIAFVALRRTGRRPA
jgi:hypothetical protein